MNSNGNQPNAALAEMMQAEHEAKEYGVAGETTIPQPPTVTQQTTRWTPPPPDWEAERLERLEREAFERKQQEEARRAIVEEELAALEAQALQPYPAAKKKRKRWGT